MPVLAETKTHRPAIVFGSAMVEDPTGLVNRSFTKGSSSTPDSDITRLLFFDLTANLTLTIKDIESHNLHLLL